ncbi:MAG: FkbM family methyltransferase [bacterium]
MPSLKRFLKLSPPYFRRFGIVRGADVLLRTIITKLRPAGETVAVTVPGLNAPLTLRARTSDVKVFHQVFVDLEHDVKSLTGDATVIVDAGANVGFSSVFFATAFPRARVIAIEPEDSNYAQLVKNSAAYPNVVPVHAALWSERRRVRIANPESEQWAFRVAASGSGDKEGDGLIAALGVADVMADYKLDHIDILKIDIEGAETEVFGSGCEAWITDVGSIVIELHDYLKDGCSTAVHSAMDRMGFGHTTRGEFVVFSRQLRRAPVAAVAE